MTAPLTRVLVVDDDQLLTEVVGAMLGDLGYEVTTSDSTAAALELLTNGSFDVVVSDLSVSGRAGGRDLLFRVLDEGLATTAILMSGYGAPDDLGSPAGHRVHFIQKPFRGEELDALMRNIS